MTATYDYIEKSFSINNVDMDMMLLLIAMMETKISDMDWQVTKLKIMLKETHDLEIRKQMKQMIHYLKLQQTNLRHDSNRFKFSVERII